MTDIERTFGSTAPAPKRRARNGWKTFSLVLLLALLIAAGYAAVTRWQATRVTKQAVEAAVTPLRTKLERFQDERDASERALAEEKGTAIALSFRLVNPDIISDEGQEITEDLLDELMKDPQIAYIALLDFDGGVCATTDLRLKQAEPPLGVTRLVIDRPGLHGSDAEILGPITDAYNNQIGTVRIGIAYGAARRALPPTKNPEPKATPPGREMTPPTPPRSIPDGTPNTGST